MVWRHMHLWKCNKISSHDKVSEEVICEVDDSLRWAEHFDELLNKEFFDQRVTSQEAYQVYSDIDEPIPRFDEVENAIQKLNGN